MNTPPSPTRLHAFSSQMFYVTLVEKTVGAADDSSVILKKNFLC